eukprot:SAG22_NODE_1244_length_5021_cov_16.855547_8_plen_172_part_00
MQGEATKELASLRGRRGRVPLKTSFTRVVLHHAGRAVTGWTQRRRSSVSQLQLYKILASQLHVNVARGPQTDCGRLRGRPAPPRVPRDRLWPTVSPVRALRESSARPRGPGGLATAICRLFAGSFGPRLSSTGTMSAREAGERGSAIWLDARSSTLGTSALFCQAPYTCRC